MAAVSARMPRFTHVLQHIKSQGVPRPAGRQSFQHALGQVRNTFPGRVLGASAHSSPLRGVKALLVAHPK